MKTLGLCLAFALFAVDGMCAAGLALRRDANLSDVANAATSRSNLGANSAANLTTGTLPDARLSSNVIVPTNSPIAGVTNGVERTGGNWKYVQVNPSAGGGGGTAASVTYDNSTSGAAATDVQAALDEGFGMLNSFDGANIQSGTVESNAVAQSVIDLMDQRVVAGTDSVTNLFGNRDIGATMDVTSFGGFITPTNGMSIIPDMLPPSVATNLTANLSIASLANVGTTNVSTTTILFIGHADNSYTVTVPAMVFTTDGLRTWTVTNACRGILTIEAYADVYTNASFQPLW